MKSIEVQLETQTILVSRLPLGKYAELLKALKELPKKLQGEGDIFNNIPYLLSEAFPEVLSILSLSTGMKKEELEKIGLDEAVALVEAVVEVNNYREVYEKIKKMTAHPKQ